MKEKLSKPHFIKIHPTKVLPLRLMLLGTILQEVTAQRIVEQQCNLLIIYLVDGFYVPEDQLVNRLHKPTTATKTEEGYLVWLEVFHQLHCVVSQAILAAVVKFDFGS